MRKVLVKSNKGKRVLGWFRWSQNKEKDFVFFFMEALLITLPIFFWKRKEKKDKVLSQRKLTEVGETEQHFSFFLTSWGGTKLLSKTRSSKVGNEYKCFLSKAMTRKKQKKLWFPFFWLRFLFKVSTLRFWIYLDVPTEVSACQ